MGLDPEQWWDRVGWDLKQMGGWSGDNLEWQRGGVASGGGVGLDPERHGGGVELGPQRWGGR